MVHNWKSASVGASLILAVAALALYVYTRPPAAQTYLLANGVQVTSIEVKPDDMAQLLDVKIWKFDVFLPKPEKGDSLVLNLYQHGKFVKALAGGGFGPSRNPSHQILVTVAVASIAGDFSKAGPVRWMVHQNGGGMSGAFVNPFQNNRGLGWNTQVAEVDNLIYLMNGTNNGVSHGNIREDDTTIALSISNTF